MGEKEVISCMVRFLIMVFRRTLLFFLSMNILLGCSSQSSVNVSEIERQFLTAIPITDMNKSLTMVVDGEEQYFSLGSDIPLIVANRSSHFVIFDIDTHIQLLMNTNSQWTEVENEITYSGILSLSPQGVPLLDFRSTWVKPVIDESILGNSTLNIPLRIVIIGEISEGDTPTGKQVGAYVDVILRP